MQGQMQRNNTIVGLDIGTTKICVIVGTLSDDEINIIGIGTHPSVGLRKGSIVNIESTVESIKKAVKEAELMSECKISSVYASIADTTIMGFNSRGIINIEGPDITKNDVARVIAAAKAIAIPGDRKVIHVLPQEYIVDDQVGIQNPIGMTGVRLESEIHIITGAATSIHNIIKCVNKAGLDVCSIVLESLASGEAILTNEEKELGAALIDLGASTSNLALFKNKNIKHTFVLSLGGNNLTNDIAIGLQTPMKIAEEVKKKLGTCNPNSISLDKTIEVQGMGEHEPRQLPHQLLGEILEPRMEEIFYLIYRELHQTKMEKFITSGIVLSGGTSLLNGVICVAESIFGVPARIGKPTGIIGPPEVINSPMNSTSIGLVIYGARRISEKEIQDQPISNGLISKIKQWVMKVF